jgi:LacI family transcriptional regulator
MKASRPDALVVSAHAVVEKLRAQDPAAVAELPLSNLHWLPTAPEIGGVDQSYDMMAANAVDLVVSQLNSNETGVPPWPRLRLFPGRWVAQRKTIGVLRDR